MTGVAGDTSSRIVEAHGTAGTVGPDPDRLDAVESEFGRGDLDGATHPPSACRRPGDRRRRLTQPVSGRRAAGRSDTDLEPTHHDPNSRDGR